MKQLYIGRVALAVSSALVLAACGGGGQAADKTGSGTVVLRLATIDGAVDLSGQGSAAQVFIDSLDDLSDGRVQVEVTSTYGDGAPDAESRLIEAIASGSLDGGWPATRAFAEAGIAGLKSVEAPLTITSQAAASALTDGPVADDIMTALEGSGVVGLGVAVEGLRRPLAADAPLLGPEDWQGARFRTYNSPVQADTVRAFGGEPANLSFNWINQFNAGTLRGAEVDFAGSVANGVVNGTGFVTANVVLWPKLAVFSLSQERYDSLTDEQRDWVSAAAAQATDASVEGLHDETAAARRLCAAGVRFIDAKPADIDELHAAASSVIDDLAADPDEAPLLAEIQTVADEFPDPDVPDVPASCQTVDGAGKPTEPSETDNAASLPDGIYRVEITLADVTAAEVGNAPGYTGTWTLSVEDATYQFTCRPLDDPTRDCGHSGGYEGPLEAGNLTGTGDAVTFAYSVDLMAELTGCQLPISTESGHCYDVAPYTMTWSVDGDTLSFDDPGGGSVSGFNLSIEPWTKIN